MVMVTVTYHHILSRSDEGWVLGPSYRFSTHRDRGLALKGLSQHLHFDEKGEPANLAIVPYQGLSFGTPKHFIMVPGRFDPNGAPAGKPKVRAFLGHVVQGEGSQRNSVGSPE